MTLCLYVVRHAEREDNVNNNWQQKYPDFADDNTPLSDRGRSQAQDLARHFADIPLEAVYASPFDRTMETATILLGDKEMAINVEPGICEALYLCERPPGFWSAERLKKKFPRVDVDYKPGCPTPLPSEGYGDSSCTPRVARALKHIVARHAGSGNVLLVGHGASIGGVHQSLGHGFQYVGQATVSLFEEVSPGSGKFRLVQSGDAAHLSKPNRANLRAY